jgi:hypothetical protein
MYIDITENPLDVFNLHTNVSHQTNLHPLNALLGLTKLSIDYHVRLFRAS